MSEKEFKNIVVVVRYIDPKTEKVTHTHIKTIDDHERRKWLLKTVMYAVMNGLIAEVVNKADDSDEE